MRVFPHLSINLAMFQLLKLIVLTMMMLTKLATVKIDLHHDGDDHLFHLYRLYLHDPDLDSHHDQNLKRSDDLSEVSISHE